MEKLDPYQLILVGSIPALITLLITQIVTFARDNRNLLLEKYEEALRSANYKYRLFHLNSVRIEKLLKSGSKIESFNLDKIQKFLREYTVKRSGAHTTLDSSIL